MAEQIPEAVFPFRAVGTTGGTGTVASNFHKVLLAQFPQVERITTTCRNLQSDRARRIPDSHRMNVLLGSCTDISVLKGVVDGGEIIYHLAAWLANTAVPGLTEVFLVNSLTAGVAARLCADQDKPLVFTSSHSVYFAGEYRGLIREDDYPFRRDFVDWMEGVSPDYHGLIDAIVGGSMSFGDASGAIQRLHDDLPPPFEPKIYDRDDYHLYCLTKLLAERLVLDHGGLVLRLSNVYGPGDESPQAVSEACQRLMDAEPGDRIGVRQPFKRLVPAYLGDIIRTFVRAGTADLPEGMPRLFTMASQSGYMREDELLRTVAAALNDIRGAGHEYDIEKLPEEDETAFTYDLTKMNAHLLSSGELTPFSEGVRQMLLWLMERAEGRPAREADIEISFVGGG